MISLLKIETIGGGFLVDADKQMVKLTFANFTIFNYHLQFWQQPENWKLNIGNRKSDYVRTGDK